LFDSAVQPATAARRMYVNQPRTGTPHTNTAEGFIGLFKRAVYGQFHMSARRTCIGISPKPISNIITAPRLVLMMRNVL
jgi:hypothetical protein